MSYRVMIEAFIDVEAETEDEAITNAIKLLYEDPEEYGTIIAWETGQNGGLGDE